MLAQGPGKRILTFVVGGITRSELRVAHALAARTGRDITIGSTSIETPASFLQRVQVSGTLFARTDRRHAYGGQDGSHARQCNVKSTASSLEHVCLGPGFRASCIRA